MRVRSYSEADRVAWNAFIDASKNGVFLFHRGYMEYHRDRFDDASLVVTDDAGAWVGALPAHREDELIATHRGLTFGGLVCAADTTTADYLQAFDALATHLRDAGFRRLMYRPVPHCYHRIPAEEDLYALFRAGAVLERRLVTTVVDLRTQPRFQSRRERGIKRAAKANVSVGFSTDFAAYWRLLEQVLNQRHGARPVHSLAEIEHLHAQFPDRIRLCTAHCGGEMVAGVVLYDNGHVARTQYIATSMRGREDGALDLLFSYLIREACSGKQFLDCGTSHTGDGLNSGLLEQKEGFGARTMVNDQYALDLERYQPGQVAAALQ